MQPPHPKTRITVALAVIACAYCVNIAQAQSRGGSGNPIDQLPKVPSPAQSSVTVVLPSGEPAAPHLTRTTIPVTFQVEGVESLPFAAVEAVFAPLVGKTVSVEALVGAAKQVTAMYQQAGYALAFCFIPEQDLSAGRVHVVIVEGFVSDVRIDGDAGGSKAAIQRVADQITSEHPLTSAGFARMVTLLARLPGVKIDASIPAPTKTDGATTLMLHVSRQAVTFSSGLDTYQPGTRLVATVTANGVTPLGDQLSVTALGSAGSDKERYLAASEIVPIGGDGLLLKLDAYHFSSDTAVSVSPTVSGEDRQADTRVSISASQPLILAVDHQLTLNGGFDVAHNTDRYRGSAASVLDDQTANLRIVHVGVSGSAAAPLQQIASSLDVYRGISGLGASVSNNTIDADFTRLVLALSDRLSWTETMSSRLAFRGQYSRDRLPSSEQIAFGGAQFGAGYPLSDEVGDRGWGLSIDVGKSFALEEPYLKSVEPYIALDTARAYSNLLAAVPPRIASFALGTRFGDKQHYNVDLSLARPIGAVPIDGERRSLRINLNYSYHTD